MSDVQLPPAAVVLDFATRLAMDPGGTEAASRSEARLSDRGPAGAAEHQEQPMPVVNDRGSVQNLVREDLVERERVGVRRYGTPLQAFNGRDALRDAYEEALDLCCYLRQAIAERDEPQ